MTVFRKNRINHLLLILFSHLIALVSQISSFNFDINKAVIHRPSFSRDSNFGFSVAGYKVDNEPWIIVGAPLTSRDRFHDGWFKSKEGAIYRCRVDKPNSCYMLPFDTKDDWNEARDHFGIYYSENKTNQLLGATLKVSDDVIMACAPNYKHVTRVLRQNEFREEPTGICYILREKMRKFEEHSPCRNSLWGHHRQGYCQAGFSAAISKNDSSLFISGPGAWYWQGMVFSINLFNKEIRHRFPDQSGEGKHDDSYRGYAIDTGHFDNDIFEDILISAPRGYHLKGSVEIFSSRFRLLNTFYGDQIGAYFGASVTAVDLNNDKYDDVIIGSPMYHDDTDSFDIGRIDVFIRKTGSFDEFSFRRVKINGFKSQSRFGSTIAKLGDVNDDGYNDIAVAAPYDGEDGSGIVYIFAGSSEGINTTPIQKLKGSDFNLKTFGYSLSGGLDLDGNQYPDLIIGAYKSNAVAYVRSRPVVKASFSTHTTPKIIDLKSPESYCDRTKKFTCMRFEACIRYFGKAVPERLTMKIALELDIEKNQNKSLQRAFFNETNTAFLTQDFTFDYNSKVCFTHIIHVKRTIRDKFNPIKCRLNVTLPRYNSARELMPLFDSKEELSKIHEIRFLRNCGPDDICKPDLKLTASSPSLTHVYGSNENIDLNIKIVNAQEDAFETQCFITLPTGVDFVKAFLSQTSLAQHTSLPCKHNKSLNHNNETIIICDIGNPLIAKASKNFTIRVSPQNILMNQDKLKFNISVSSSNKEDSHNQFDNEKYVYVVMKATPAVALIGKQYQEQVVYETKFESLKSVEEMRDEMDIGPEIIHEYKMINNGPSQISLSEMIIAWQRRIKIGSENRDFLYLMELPYTEGPVKCHIDHRMVNSMNITQIEGDQLMNPEKYYQSGGSKHKRHNYKQSMDNNKNYGFKPPHNLVKMHNIHKLDYYQGAECSFGMIKTSKNYKHSFTSLDRNNDRYLDIPMTNSFDYYCGSIHCDIGSLMKDQSAMVRLRFRLWSKNLALIPDVYKVKTYAINAVTQIPYKKIDLNLEQLRMTTQIETVAYPKERRQLLEQIDIQIVLMSVITGIILLLVLIIILWGCGFFKRFEPQEMKKLEDASATDEDTSSNDVIDISKDCDKIDIGHNREMQCLVDSNLTVSNDEFHQRLNPHAEPIYRLEKYQNQLCSTPEKHKQSQNIYNNQTQLNTVPNSSPQHVSNMSGVAHVSDLSIYSSPRIEIRRDNYEQGFDKNSIDNNKFSTFQTNTNKSRSSMSPTYISNEAHFIQDTNGQKLISKPMDYQSNLNSDMQRELLIKLKNQIEENNYNNQNSQESNNKAPVLENNIRNSPKPDNYTSKLPPVPRRNSKNSLNNPNRMRTLSPLNQSNNSQNIRFMGSPHSHSPNHHMILTNGMNMAPLSPTPSMNMNSNSNPNKKNFYQKI